MKRIKKEEEEEEAEKEEKVILKRDYWDAVCQEWD